MTTTGRAQAGAGSGRTSPTEAFFTELAARKREPLLRSASGTVRFDLTDGDRIQHWYVTIHGGDVTVSRKNAKADAVVRLERTTFDGMATGSVNAMAAVLRGELVAEGNLSLVMLLQRVFRSPGADVREAGGTAAGAGAGGGDGTSPPLAASATTSGGGGAP